MKNRDFTRVNYAAGVSVRYDRQESICSTGNLSLHGMYLKTVREIPLDVPVQVTVYHADLSSFALNARVVRREENGIGLEISNLSIDSFVQLRDLVAGQTNNQGAIMQETFKMLKCIC